MSTHERPSRAVGKRARTRAALVAATLDVVADKGFAAAGLDEIAARAGMTKGAIYSNFSSKAELLVAALGAKGLTLSSLRPHRLSLPEELTAMAADLSTILANAAGSERLIAEFQVYALGDPELRKDLAQTYSKGFDHAAGYLASLKGTPPAIPPRRLAVALQAVALGFLIQSLITPHEVNKEVIDETLAALGRGLTRPRLTKPGG
jgi:AcrR family transcriptional regulator